jgi:hypothetical protein
MSLFLGRIRGSHRDGYEESYLLTFNGLHGVIFLKIVLCRLDDRGVGVRFPMGSRTFSSLRRPDRFWGPPASYLMVTGG